MLLQVEEFFVLALHTVPPLTFPCTPETSFHTELDQQDFALPSR